MAFPNPRDAPMTIATFGLPADMTFEYADVLMKEFALDQLPGTNLNVECGDNCAA
jgi:hypothetical protein